MYGETCTVLYTAPHVLILCERKSRNQLSSITNYIKSYKLVLQSLSQELKIFPRNRERGKKKRKEMKNKRTKIDNPLEGFLRGDSGDVSAAIPLVNLPHI